MSAHSETRFAITRDDGRSNAQVVVDLVKDGAPGRIYTIEEFQAALAVGTDRTFDLRAVQQIVRNMTNALEKTYKRTLHAVPTVGYRLACAKEHMGLAVLRQDKANRQLRKGLHILENVRYDEMDENTRSAHEGHLILTSAIYRNQIALESRMRRVEETIQGIRTSVAAPAV